MFYYQLEDNLNKVVNVGYWYCEDVCCFNGVIGWYMYGCEDDIIKQYDFLVIWLLVLQWFVFVCWQYDYNKNCIFEVFGGFEYDSCCWKLCLINCYWLDVDDDVFFN